MVLRLARRVCQGTWTQHNRERWRALRLMPVDGSAGGCHAAGRGKKSVAEQQQHKISPIEGHTLPVHILYELYTRKTVGERDKLLVNAAPQALILALC